MKDQLQVLVIALTLTSVTVLEEQDWPQWRGPDRNGISTSEMKLTNTWPETGPKLLWERELVPSGDDGGFGSVVAMDGKA